MIFVSRSVFNQDACSLIFKNNFKIMCIFHFPAVEKGPSEAPDMRPEMVNIIFGQLKKPVGNSSAVPPPPPTPPKKDAKKVAEQSTLT